MSEMRSVTQSSIACSATQVIEAGYGISMKRRSISPPAKRPRLGTKNVSQSTSSRAPVATAYPSRQMVIYSWNVNGIAPFLQPSIASFFQTDRGNQNNREANVTASLRAFLRRHEWPTMLFLQEVKINPSDETTIRSVQKAINTDVGMVSRTDHDPKYEAHFCLPNDRFNARGFGRRVYGVCSIIRTDFMTNFVDKIRPVAWDSEGRVLVIETKPTEHTPKLAIFNIYAVNGTSNPYKNSQTGEVIGTRHDRKLEFHRHLHAECRSLEDRGFGVVLAGDMNVARGVIDGYPNLRTQPHQHVLNRADFEAKFFSSCGRTDPNKEEASDGVHARGLGMIDTFRYLHPTKRAYTYYPRTPTFGDSCDRVDLIMASSGLEREIVEAGMYESPQERGKSDHVPLFAKFEFSAPVKVPTEMEEAIII